MPAVYASPTNVYVPSHAATKNLVVDFARNPNKFAINRYCQVVPVTQLTGYYLNISVEEAGRIVDTDLDDFVWPDGDPAPEGNDSGDAHEFLPYRCVRRAFPFKLGNMTVENASWDIVARYARSKAQQAMTARTQLAINVLTNTANYDASHVLDVTAVAGAIGTWAESTTARQSIKRCLNAAMEKILDDTLDGVEPEDFRLVISSALAADISVCQEIVDYIKGSPHALAQIKGELKGRNTVYGLPDELYGIELVVEKTRKVTSRKGATTVRTQVLPKATPLLLSRPGGLVGVEAAPSFSTCSLFAYRELETYVKNDKDNERTIGRVVETLDAKLTAPAAGVLFTNAA